MIRILKRYQRSVSKDPVIKDRKLKEEYPNPATVVAKHKTKATWIFPKLVKTSDQSVFYSDKRMKLSGKSTGALFNVLISWTCCRNLLSLICKIWDVIFLRLLTRADGHIFFKAHIFPPPLPTVVTRHLHSQVGLLIGGTSWNEQWMSGRIN